MIPPIQPTSPSARRPPPAMRGISRDTSIAGHQSSNRTPTPSLNVSGSRWGSSATPSGTPRIPPATKGQISPASNPRRTVPIERSCPNNVPNATSGPARTGSMDQAHIAIAVRPKAKPDRPWTKPPIAAPRATKMMRWSSVIVGAAVDVDRLAGDEAAVVADEKEASGGDLVDMPLPAERDAGRIRHTALVPFGVVPPGIDAAGGHHIGANVVR